MCPESVTQRYLQVGIGIVNGSEKIHDLEVHALERIYLVDRFGHSLFNNCTTWHVPMPC